MGSTLLVVGAILLGAATAAQEKPLPDRQKFFETARANLERSQGQQSQFAYRERRRQLHTNPFGRIGSGMGTEEFAVTPMADGSVTRTLVAQDGKPVKDGQTSRSRPRARTSRRSAAADTAAAIELVLDRREQQNGRDVLVVRFSPKPGAEPETREGKLARNFHGKIFVDEADAEVVRVEATAVQDISYGLGVVARLNKGATVTLVRERVDGDIWMPTSIRLTGDGRAILFRKLHVDHLIEWFDYRRVGEGRAD